MLCFLLVDDSLAEAVLGPKGKGLAFWRAFIVEDRVTGEVRVLWRYLYPNGRKSWYEAIATGKKGQDAMVFLKCMLEDVLETANKAIGLPFQVQAFYPPDDGGDGIKTIIWLEQQDLIDVRVETLGADGLTDSKPN